jgi:hypothetical protein
MPRQLKDWLPAFMEYTAGTEAPRNMHFWTGVATMAGVLRRRVWIDMKRFKWYPNFYVVLVAPPGIISKTTTMDMGIDLLKQVPGVHFGPDVVTWQQLVTKFAASREEFEYNGEWLPMSALTLASGELGNLFNPQDRDMVNLYITLWDGRSSFEKETKTSGNDTISAPWINMIGCTTPHWIADNMPSATVGGGFTSRCIFVYGDKKENLIALPDEFTPPHMEAFQAKLVADLEDMAVNLTGPFTILEEARGWIRSWYEMMWGVGSKSMDDDRLEGYLARKQTHMMKLSMVLSASRGDDMRITLDDIMIADKMLSTTEEDLPKVFSRIGRSEVSLQAERLIGFVRRHKKVRFELAYQYIHSYFPDYREFQGIVDGAIRSGQVKMSFEGELRIGPDGKPMQDSYLIYVGA